MKNNLVLLFILAIQCGAKELKGSSELGADSFLFSDNSITYSAKKIDSLCALAKLSDDADSIVFYSDLAYSHSVNDNICAARSLSLSGIGYLKKGNLSTALEKFLLAAKLFEKIKDNISLASVYTYIANTYNSQQNHQNSIYYLKKAIELFSEENDSIRLAMAQHNLGYEYYKINQFDSALLVFSQSERILRNAGFESDYAYCIGNTGLVYSKLHELDSAEKYLLIAINILQKIGDDYAIAEYMIENAHILQQKGEINPAIVCGIKSFRIASKNNIAESKRDAAFRLASLYGQTHKFDSAFYFQSLFIAYSDSIKNLETIQKMADLRTEYEVSQKQKEVDILQKNKTIQQIVIGALIIVILLGGGLILMYYKSLKRSRKFSTVLEERRKMLEQQSAELKQLNRIKDRFFSIISHDLRGPIGSLGGISTLINEGVESKNQALLKEITDYIDQTVLSLTGLLENLLNWALSQQGQLMYKEERVDVKKLINEVVEVFTSVSLSKNIQLKLKLQKDLFIAADTNSMMMIVRNLLSNALKFTGKGGKINITSRINNEGLAEIKISDNGVGMSEEKLAVLFELKEDKSTRGTEKEKGIGLGLTLVKEFIELNKGKISVTSKVGKGSSFTLYIPLQNTSIC